jgi:hypothetical protein
VIAALPTCANMPKKALNIKLNRKTPRISRRKKRLGRISDRRKNKV